MIKICSLEFLNSELFEADIMSADGNVIFNSDDKVTPELILKLYFKDIYVEDLPLEEDIKVNNVIEPDKELFDGGTVSIPSEQTEEAEEDDNYVHVKSFSASAVNGSVATSEVIDGVLDKAKSAEETEEALAEANAATDNTLNAELPTEEETQASSKTSGKSASKHDAPPEPVKEEIVEEVEEIDPEEVPLVFDENLAKKIVQNSVKIGKMLGYSQKDLKELEQVAYYCNIGISKFKKKDLGKRNFNKMKAYASYEHLVENETVPPDIAEMVKYCGTKYESEAFPLDSKIPYYHVVAITSFYEDLLMHGQSKDEVLLKMLQLGGNKFNIFVLHKFIKTMRDSNE